MNVCIFLVFCYQVIKYNIHRKSGIFISVDQVLSYQGFKYFKPSGIFGTDIRADIIHLYSRIRKMDRRLKDQRISILKLGNYHGIIECD